jgi:uncharacterized protein (DUF1697 family)
MSPGPRPAVYVALLRGINVGGKNVVSMKALKASFEGLRFQDVRTYINSGNVLFRAGEPDPRKLEDRIDRMLTAEYGLKGKTVVRTAAEMARLVKTIDKTWGADPEWRYNVAFLRHTIDSKRILEGVETRPEFESIVYCPGTLLWSARIDMPGRTAMFKVARESKDQEMTVRNVNTTRKLLELMRQMESSS